MNLLRTIKYAINAARIRALHYKQIIQFARAPHREKEPLLVYQMGKVGSSTIRRSINALNLNIHPYHLHYMSGIDYMVGLCRKQLLPLREHILSSIYCKKLIKKSIAEGKKTKIITLVREPIAKNISQYFQSIRVSYPEFEYEKKEKTLDQEQLIDEMISFFLENFIHDDPLVWFDVELKRFTKIDVFAVPFPFEKGYMIYENDNFKVLLVRLESMNHCISGAMAEFIGLKGFSLFNDNISSEKDYAELYHRVKNKIALPQGYIEKMYNSKLTQHFYTQSEVETLKKKWLHKSRK